MKRFGVQLAAGGIVILLGALGVAQAQRDSSSKESAEWDQQSTPGLTPTPAPIAALEPDPAADNPAGDAAASGPSSLALGSFGFPAVSSPGVRTVGHEEPLDAANASPSPSFTGVADADPNAGPSGLSGFAMPVAFPPSDQAPPPSTPLATEIESSAPSMLLPTYNLPPGLPLSPNPTDANNVRPSAAADQPALGSDNFASMPTLQLDTSAANGLRDADASNPAPLGIPLQPLSVSQAEAIPLRPMEEPAMGVDAISADVGPAARIASLPREGQSHLRRLVQTPSDETVLAEPGDRRLEGMQSPSVVIHKRAPDEVKVGKPATFVIQVQNVGSAEALAVVVEDRIPVGMRLLDASPTPSVQGDLLTWELGALEPGGERTVTLQLVPEREGELGSVARVTFEAAASVRTISTRPELKITQRAPEQVLIGQQLEIELEVSNPGSGAATGVVMQEDVPEGLEHPKGRQLDNVIGTLAPGEVRRQVLRLRAVAPGQIENHIRLMGDDGLVAEHMVVVQVIAPELSIELEGPSRRFLERQATFNVNLANIGTADATNVEVVAYLDRGFSFVATEYQGQYDPNRHAVYWSLAELPAEGRGSVPLKLLPIEQGERAIRLEAKGDLNVLAQCEKNVSVDTLAELTFSITDDADPIEVGSEATYEIRISNRGSRDDSNVKMQMLLPPGLELVSSEAEANTDGRGLIAFSPTVALPAGGDTVHRVRVRGVAPGTHVVKAIVTSAQATVPVTKEESTMVYADQ